MTATATQTETTSELHLARQGEREIVLSRTFNAPRDKLFDALTVPALITRWLLGPPGWTMPVCEVDLRPGGAYRYRWEREAEARARDAQTCGADMMPSEMDLSGSYREVARPDRLVHTETFDPAWYPGEALITSTLTEKDGKTTLSATILYETKEARDMVAASPMAQGVAMSYDRLDALLTSDD